MEKYKGSMNDEVSLLKHLEGLDLNSVQHAVFDCDFKTARDLIESNNEFDPNGLNHPLQTLGTFPFNFKQYGKELHSFISFLIEKGLNVNSDKSIGIARCCLGTQNSKLHPKCILQQVDLIRLFLEYGFGTGNNSLLFKESGVFPNKTNWTKDFVQEFNKSISKSIKLLIKAGANVNSQSYEGDTPLHEACMASNYRVVEILLENSANPNLVDCYGFTPIDKAFDRLTYLDLEQLGHEMPRRLQVDETIKIIKLLASKGAKFGKDKHTNYKRSMDLNNFGRLADDDQIKSLKKTIQEKSEWLQALSSDSFERNFYNMEKKLQARSSGDIAYDHDTDL